MQNKKTDYKRPCVYFSEDDAYLLDYAQKQDDNFAAYVRKLIKDDMERGSEDGKIRNIVEEVMRENVPGFISEQMRPFEKLVDIKLKTLEENLTRLIETEVLRIIVKNIGNRDLVITESNKEEVPVVIDTTLKADEIGELAAFMNT